nr:uncharacterized protein LOC113806652 [Penaeus vannamei]
MSSQSFNLPNSHHRLSSVIPNLSNSHHSTPTVNLFPVIPTMSNSHSQPAHVNHSTFHIQPVNLFPVIPTCHNSHQFTTPVISSQVISNLSSLTIHTNLSISPSLPNLSKQSPFTTTLSFFQFIPTCQTSPFTNQPVNLFQSFQPVKQSPSSPPVNLLPSFPPVKQSPVITNLTTSF